MKLLWHGLPGTTQLLENVSVRIDHAMAGNQHGSRQVWLWEAIFCGQSPPLILLLPLGFCGVVADPAHGTGLVPEGLAALLLLVSAPWRLSHTLDSTHLQPKQTLFTSQVGFKFCSFCSCFSFRFFGWFKFDRQFRHWDRGGEYSLEKSRWCVCLVMLLVLDGPWKGLYMNRVCQLGLLICGTPLFSCRMTLTPDFSVLHVHVCPVAQSCLTLCDPMCSLPGSSSHEVFQARILEWVGIASSRGFSQTRDPTHVCCVSVPYL